jgi:hypothetical protein
MPASVGGGGVAAASRDDPHSGCIVSPTGSRIGCAVTRPGPVRGGASPVPCCASAGGVPRMMGAGSGQAGSTGAPCTTPRDSCLPSLPSARCRADNSVPRSRGGAVAGEGIAPSPGSCGASCGASPPAAAAEASGAAGSPKAASNARKGPFPVADASPVRTTPRAPVLAPLPGATAGMLFVMMRPSLSHLRILRSLRVLRVSSFLFTRTCACACVAGGIDWKHHPRAYGRSATQPTCVGWRCAKVLFPSAN